MNFQPMKDPDVREKKTVSFEGTVQSITKADISGHGRIALIDVVVDGKPFRDHVWTRINKQFYSLGAKKGDRIKGSAKLYTYLSPDNKGYYQRKQGLKKLRSLTIDKAQKTVQSDQKTQGAK